MDPLTWACSKIGSLDVDFSDEWSPVAPVELADRVERSASLNFSQA